MSRTFLKGNYEEILACPLVNLFIPLASFYELFLSDFLDEIVVTIELLEVCVEKPAKSPINTLTNMRDLIRVFTVERFKLTFLEGKATLQLSSNIKESLQ